LKEDAKGSWSYTGPRVAGDLGYQAIHEEKRSEPELYVNLVCADIDFLPFSEGRFTHVFMFTVLSGVHAYWGDTISEALRMLGTHGIITLSVPKQGSSSEKLLGKLSINGLESRELLDDDRTVDYLVISEKSPHNCRKSHSKQSLAQVLPQESRQA
jgi:ubiquinone/menaquinone biosynthesis C-methylase UbiE